jgi:hypothetical protein
MSRCHLSVARKWQLASRLHLLQFCLPNVLLSSVQCLTDVPCCAAGSCKNQNHNSEEHLDAVSATVCVAELLSAVIIQWREVTQHLVIGCHSCGGIPTVWSAITQSRIFLISCYQYVWPTPFAVHLQLECKHFASYQGYPNYRWDLTFRNRASCM